MGKKLLFGLFVLVLAALPLLSSCGSSTPTEVIELKLSTHNPTSDAVCAVYEEWADKIEEETDGQVEITIYYSSTLIGEQDILQAVQENLVDIGDVSTARYSDLFPLHRVLCLPFLFLGDIETGCKLYSELEDEFPEMEAEFEDYKVMFIRILSGAAINTTGKEVRVPADVDGLLINMAGTGAQIFDNAGAACMVLDTPDWYTSLERGLCEAFWMPLDVIYAVGIHELLTYHAVFPSTVELTCLPMLMNLDTWNSLPSDVQDVFDDLRPWAEERLAQVLNQATGDVTSLMEGLGHTFYTLTEDEQDLWKEAALPVIEEYLADLDAQGLPATEIYEEAIRLAEEYND